MKKNNQPYKKLFFWLLVVAWIGMLFFFSSQTAADSAELSGKTIRILLAIFHPQYLQLTTLQQSQLIAELQHLVRNAAHVFSYFILAILCMLALLQHQLKNGQRATGALFLCIVYAFSDEMHQLFVTGRAFEVTDLGLDICGALAGITVILIIMFLKRQKIKRQMHSL